MTTREVPLTQGYVALVDDEDYDRVMQHKWHADIDRHRGTRRPDVVYARRSYRVKIDGVVKVRCERMHNFILGSREDVDHEDGDGLNNRRSNLRHATDSQNCSNRRKRSTSASQFKGVFRARKRNGEFHWRVRVALKGVDRHIGYFDDEEAAALAYDQAAKEVFGEFARLNFPERLSA